MIIKLSPMATLIHKRDKKDINEHVVTSTFAVGKCSKWTFLLRLRWTKVKGLYIIAPYVPFVLIIWPWPQMRTPRWSPDQIHPGFYILRNPCSPPFFQATIVLCIGLLLAAGATSEVVTGIPETLGCSRSSYGIRLFLPSVLMFVFQLGLVYLTIILILAILATRMHLCLWHMEWHVDGSEALVHFCVRHATCRLYGVTRGLFGVVCGVELDLRDDQSGNRDVLV
ncbi:hypothetical protein DFJ58DRAFT_918290 [Suillus subalutaceus]|uniref:uncharacterized protein n=1 Tax=Suillus subalutaceus TaxID=48586 RepID=UPI001B8725CA|nr:uncharacterized protein DFJ58DRAFT_918290 [Suillus subalutaceus]KAG1831159.1 hypothetical protein DFJ58DRAFT_918290 [Suillus subalutaceus]